MMIILKKKRLKMMKKKKKKRNPCCKSKTGSLSFCFQESISLYGSGI